MEALTRIQGSPSSTLTPLFLIHAAAGSALSYFGLGSLSEDEQRPVYGISSPFYSQRNYRLPHSLQDIAYQYIEMVREVQPKGPYLLGGWSMGGMIAMKMARILQAEGEQVLHVILIDSASPECAPHFTDAAEHAAISTSLSNAVMKRLGIPPVSESSHSSAYEDEAKENSETEDEDFTDVALVVKKVQKHISNSVRVIADEEHDPAAKERSFYPVTLIKCTARPPQRSAAGRKAVRDARRAYEYKVFEEDTMGWDAGMFEQFTVVRFSAYHDAAFDPPYTGELTEKMRNILTTVRA